MRALVTQEAERATELLAELLNVRDPEKIREEVIGLLVDRLAERIEEHDRGQLVTAEVIADRLAVRREQVYELSRRSRDPLPSLAIGGQKRFCVADVDDWVRGQAS